jgi:hypothetical protein
VFDNEDVATYQLAQGVLAREHQWMEQGMIS